MIELHKKLLALLESQFNIKFAINCRDFDTQPEVLIEKLTLFQNQVFSPTDKILLVHMDTDYYDPLLPCGTIPINVTRIFKNLDIPIHAILFVTNHFGIKKEFDYLLKDHHFKDRPTIIETLLSPILFPSEIQETNNEISFDAIEKSAICMMSKKRSHRVAFYNFLTNNNLLDKVAISQNFDALSMKEGLYFGIFWPKHFSIYFQT